MSYSKEPEPDRTIGREKVLLIEDDPQFAHQFATFLASQGYDVDVVPTAAEMFQKLEGSTYDCLIVDLTLPDEDGIVLVRKLRARAVGPLLVLTAREGIDDVLAAFEAGADDYVTKGVDPREIAMRIKALRGRSTAWDVAGTGKFNLGPFVLDHERREVLRKNGSSIDLTPAEFSLLRVLAQADGKVLSRDDLVDAVSNGDGPASTRAVDILVSRIRRKLQRDAILTVPRIGYRCGWSISAC